MTSLRSSVLAATLAFVALGSAPSDEPTIELLFIRGERSKDSHRHTWRISLDGSRVRYHGPHGPGERGLVEHVDATFALSPAQQRNLAALLDYQPIESFSEERSTAGLGNYVQVSLRLDSADGPAQVTLAGMTNVFNAPEDDPRLLSAVAQGSLRRLAGLLRFFNDAATPHLSAPTSDE